MLHSSKFDALCRLCILHGQCTTVGAFLANIATEITWLKIWKLTRTQMPTFTSNERRGTVWTKQRWTISKIVIITNKYDLVFKDEIANSKEN